MKRLMFAAACAAALAGLVGCQTNPIVEPVDIFVNATAGPELEWYWKNDLATTKKFVSTQGDLDARMMNLETMRKLVEAAKGEEKKTNE